MKDNKINFLITVLIEIETSTEWYKCIEFHVSRFYCASVYILSYSDNKINGIRKRKQRECKNSRFSVHVPRDNKIKHDYF